MKNSATYYQYNGYASRVFSEGGLILAEVYKPGQGFEYEDAFEVMHEGTLISKSEFDNLVLKRRR